MRTRGRHHRIGRWPVLALGLGLALGCGRARKLMRKGAEYQETGRYAAAARSYESVLERRPGEPRALLGVAMARLALGEPTEAVVPAQVAYAKGLPGAARVLARALVNSGRGAEGLAPAEAALAEAPEASEALVLVVETRLAVGNLDGAVEVAEKGITQGGGASAVSLAAWTHARTGNCDRATALAARTIGGVNDDSLIHATAGAVFRLCGDGDRAQRASNSARTLHSGSFVDWVQDAQNVASGDDTEGAIRRYSLLRVVEPADGRFARQLGVLWLRAEEPELAVSELRQALALAPYSQGQKTHGVEVATRGSKLLDPEARLVAVVEIWDALADSHRAAGDAASVAAAKQQSATLRKVSDPVEWLAISQLWEQARNYPEGLKVALFAVDLAPGDPRGHIQSAHLSALIGDTDRAVGHARTAWELGAINPDVAVLLGSLYEKRGDIREARAVYATALERFPKDRRLQDGAARLAR